MKLQPKMTTKQMAEHMKENSYRNVNRVNVGLYAKALGYRIYKCMIDGKVIQYYINEAIAQTDEDNACG